jgi:hypothetical protein
VIHMGDTFFNGFYPVIDASTGGKIDGMIVAADKVLPLADNNTKIVPGPGPLGNKADLTKFRDMLVVARDRVQKLKTAGKSAGDIAASKPFADLDATWGKGFFNSDVFAGWCIRSFESRCSATQRRGRSAVRPLWLIQVRLLMNRLVAILFEHRKSNFPERGRERGVSTIQ